MCQKFIQSDKSILHKHCYIAEMGLGIAVIHTHGSKSLKVRRIFLNIKWKQVFAMRNSVSEQKDEIRSTKYRYR